MRKQQKQPKTEELVAIPKDFASLLADVHRLIIEEDESAILESNDLLQCERACGGLIDTDSSKYCFTYYPDPEGVRRKWEVILDKGQIEGIGKGEIRELRLWVCKDASCGCRFSSEDGLCFY